MQVKFCHRFLFAAKCPNDPDTGEIFSGKSCDFVKFPLYFPKQGDAEIHNEKDGQKKYRNGYNKNQGAAHIDSKGHDHGTKDNKRAAQQQAEPHVEAVLYLVNVIGKPCNQSICSQPVKLGEGKTLYMVKDSLSKLGGKAGACLCGKKLGCNTDSQTGSSHEKQDKKILNDNLPVISRNSHINHTGDDHGNQQVKYYLQKLEKGSQYAFFFVVFQVDSETSHVLFPPFLK